MEYRDYYATLGVPRTASQADIKKAFRKLARQHHPDVNKGDSAAEKRFKEISEANEVLSDPEKRKLYDQLGSNWQAYQPGAAGSSAAGSNPGGVRYEYRGNAQDLAGFSDFFRAFFGGDAGTNEPGGAGRPRTQTRVRTGSIEDLFSGMGRQPARSGGGRAAGRTRLEAEAEVTLEEVADGTKRLLDLDGRRIEVTIPGGVADNQRIRFSGVGGGADAYIKVKVKVHPVFTRDGANLQRELALTLREALLGAEVAVKTLTGRVLLRIPPETQTGRSFRLAGQGLPHFRRDGRGDLYVKVRVVLPTGLTPEAKTAAQEFLALAEQNETRPA